MTDYALVLTRRYPDADWDLNGDTYSGLTWRGPGSKPTKTALDAAWPDVQYEVTVQAIQHQRQARYQAETDPMFYRVQRGEEGITLDDWKAAVDQIRADLPYPPAP